MTHFYLRSVKKLLVLVAIFVLSSAMFQSNAHAERLRNSDKFMKRYCVYVGAKLVGLDGVLRAVRNLIAQLENIDLTLAAVSWSVKPPSLECLNGLQAGVGVSGGDLAGLAQCFEGLIPKITFPNLDQLAGCLKDLIPKIRYQLPDFDPNKCMPNASINLDLNNLFDQLQQILASIRAVLKALKDIRPRLEAGLDPTLIAHIKALLAMCRSAGIKARK